MISFAGGLPSPESFPAIEKPDIPPSALQYGTSEGDSSIREWIAGDLCARGLKCTDQQVLVLSGSQQGIDLVAKLLVEPGSTVAIESPSYLAAIQVFTLFGASYLPFQADNPAALSNHGDLALTYAIPTFQNPTGHCYSTAQRQALAETCDANGSILFEDDPYRELYYQENLDRTPVCSLLKRSSWIYQSSFSKTLAPGLRLGYLAASEDLFPWLVKLKQAADLHSNRVSQHLVLQLCKAPEFPRQQAALRAKYRTKRDVFQQYLGAAFGDLASWSVPQGGLFFWLTLHGDRALDSSALLTEALDRNVSFMPGEAFFTPGNPVGACLRLNFSHASSRQMAHGLDQLAALVREHLKS